jgi:hypothetical protein
MNGVIDSQIKPEMSPPEVCKYGCARWDNLAADGNTKNQTDANSLWANSTVPKDVNNQCAMPVNGSQQGPWCYCAKTNNDSWGYCQNKDTTADICKATPNNLDTLITQMNNCRSTKETDRINTFMTKNLKLTQDIENMTMIIADSLSMGDSMYGTTGYKKIVNDVKQRNSQLKETKENLAKELKEKEAIIERSERDFIDVRQRLPEKIEKKRLNVIEDYSIAILFITYLFALVSCIYLYVSMSSTPSKAIVEGIVGGTIISIVLFVLFFVLV